jgi:hypothetical protein
LHEDTAVDRQVRVSAALDAATRILKESGSGSSIPFGWTTREAEAAFLDSLLPFLVELNVQFEARDMSLDDSMTKVIQRVAAGSRARHELNPTCTCTPSHRHTTAGCAAYVHIYGSEDFCPCGHETGLTPTQPGRELTRPTS